MQGVPIRDMSLLPGIDPELGFYFGYVAYGDGGTWVITAAPFIVAAAWVVAGYAACRAAAEYEWPPRARTLLFAAGIISPLADLIYNYQGGLWREGSDVWELFAALPDALVHGYFFAAIGLCILAMRRLRQEGPNG